MRCFTILSSSLVLFASGPTLADLAFTFELTNVVSPAHPSTTVEVWAHFDDQYAFAGALWDVNASADPGDFSDPYAVLHALGTSNGVVAPDGDSVGHIIAGQAHFPIGDVHADTSNPILVWTATWSTDDFTPRSVDLTTSTQKYFLYVDESGFSQEYLSDDFKEAFASISVVPTPGAAAATFVGVLAFARRSRGN